MLDSTLHTHGSSLARLKKSIPMGERSQRLGSNPTFLSPGALFWGALVSAGIAAGCDGSITGSAPEAGDGDEPIGTIGEDDIPTPSTRFRRLTHAQWANTTRDLFRLTGGPISDSIETAAGSFLADPVQGGFIFEGNGDALEVDSARWRAYQRAASSIAFQVVSDAALLTEIVPAGASDDERGAAFIASWGERAHRRPLSEAEIESYRELFELGKTSYTEHSGLEGGVRLVIESVLQSPHFLYRVEQSDDARSGVVPLDGYERATRLSYFLWGTMPDDALFEAARSGALSTAQGVREQAARLAADVRARDTVIEFFEKVLEVDHYATISPSATAFPGVSGPELAASAEEETALFLGGVMYDDRGSLHDFLTSTKTFVNGQLASIYGLAGTFDNSFQEVQLDSAERAGILTQIGFLASNATSVDPDPIHRGVFLARRMSCIPIMAPPDSIPPLPSPNGQSNRQLVTEHTEAEGTSCRNCHTSIINPFGFAYEHYDAIGAFRTEDRSHPVDSQAEVMVDGGTALVQDAVQLAQVLSDSKQVHECMLGHLISFAQGRTKSAEDSALIEELGTASLTGAVPFRDLIVELAVADSFLNRSTEVE